MKKVIKKIVISMIAICLTLTSIGGTEASAASYKKSVSKTISVTPYASDHSYYDTVITITLKKDATIKCTVKPKDGKPCALQGPGSQCDCSRFTILNHYEICCDCDRSNVISSFSDYGADKYTGKIKLSKGTHKLLLQAIGDGTHPDKQTVKLNIQATNGKNLIRLDKVEKKVY